MSEQQYFICSCCDCGFYSTQEEQEQHDRDAGYGVCESCEKWIGQHLERELQRAVGTLCEALNEENAKRLQEMTSEQQANIVQSALDEGILTHTIEVEKG